MSRLCLENKDANIINSAENLEKLEKTSTDFIAEVNRIVETRYKSDESEEMYSLYDDIQLNLLNNYFKGFSVEIYKDLNGTVELQIQKKNEKVKAKINKLMEALAIKKFNLDDWVYDGMTDAGKNAGQKCDLCPRPVRYAHFAANKKTHEVLRFGCNCAADFFNIDKTTLASMRTIQANTLKDIKIISCIVENNWYEPYYKYMAGYMGKVYLESGVDGLRDLMTFMVKWENGKLVGDSSKDAYPIKFGTNEVTVKSLDWIKSNIVSCLNADLDDDIYSSLSDRKLIPLTTKNMDKGALNTANYVDYALKFIQAGLPIPLSLCKKVNGIISRVTRQHHPDYIKFAQELLISHNLAKSNLLRTAFTDFIINYLASSMGVEERDRELRYWNIRGQVTFYYAVLTWETMITKLMAIKDVKTLVNKGLISEEELNKLVSKNQYGYDKIIQYVNDCITLFMSNKEVVKVPENLDAGYSKYMLKDVDKKIGVDLGKDVAGHKSKREIALDFTADVIPFNIAYHYANIQNGYSTLIKESIAHILKFLKHIELLDTSQEIMRYLCYLSKNNSGVNHEIMTSYGYYSNCKDKSELLLKLENASIDEDFYNEMLSKYHSELVTFKQDCSTLYTLLSQIAKNLKKTKGIKKPTEIYDDYDDLVVKQDKTNKEYFQDYCDLLISKRANKRLQPYLCQKNLNDLIAFKELNKYNEMLKDIHNSFVNNLQSEEELKLYEYLSLGALKNHLKKLLDTNDLDTFILAICFLFCKENNCLEVNNNVYVDMTCCSDSLKDNYIIDKLKESVPSDIYNVCCKDFRNIFELLYNSMKELYIGIKSDKLGFVGHYSLISNPSKEMVKYLKSNDLLTCYGYKTKLDDVHSCQICYTNSELYYGRLLDYLGVYKGFDGVKDKIYDLLNPSIENYKVEAKRRIEESRVKGPLLEELKVHLNEHIKFFEVDVDSERKNNPSGTKRSTDEGVRRKVAFKNIRYESSSEMIDRFIGELAALGESKWNAGVSDIIDKCSDISVLNNNEIKKYADALRSENYNHNLIFNHFNLTYHILKDLENMDLSKLEKDEIIELSSYLKVYYLLKTDIEFIYNINVKYNSSTVDLSSEFNSLSKPELVNIEELLNNHDGQKDSTGYTGVEKAELVAKHSDFDTLPSYLCSIVNSVRKFKSCSPKQLIHVNKAFSDLGLGSPDALPKNNVSSDSDDNEDKELALKLINHPDFKTLPDLVQKICTTVSKTGICSSKQKYHLEKGKTALKL